MAQNRRERRPSLESLEGRELASIGLTSISVSRPVITTTTVQVSKPVTITTQKNVAVVHNDTSALLINKSFGLSAGNTIANDVTNTVSIGQQNQN